MAAKDLNEAIDWSAVECLNQKPDRTVQNALKQGCAARWAGLRAGLPAPRAGGGWHAVAEGGSCARFCINGWQVPGG